MLSSRTPREALETAFREIERNIDIGLCPGCALTITAHIYKSDRDKLEDLWIDQRVAQLEGEANGATS